MSLEKDITIIKELVEANPVFKAASPANLNKRQEYMEIEQAKERERLAIERAKEEKRLARERADRFKELGPKLYNIMQLMPTVKSLDDEYIELSDSEFKGNYGKIGEYDHPTQVSFNIKIYGQSIPDDVRDKLEKYGLENSAYEIMNEDMSLYATDFFDNLQSQYSFISNWYQEGRSSGWVVFEIDDVAGTDDAQQLMYYFQDADTAVRNTEDWNDNDFEAAYIQLKSYAVNLKKRISNLEKIEKKILKGKRDLIAWQSSKEYWDTFFSNYEDDIAEQDAKEQTEREEQIQSEVGEAG
jgi:hypothetical protein